MSNNRRLGLEVSVETCVPNWHGESMDADMAIAKLVELEGPG